MKVWIVTPPPHLSVPLVTHLILRSHEVASRRRFQSTLETPSSFETA